MQKTIYLPDDGTWERIAAAAERAGESVSEYLRRAAEERMEHSRSRRVPPPDGTGGEGGFETEGTAGIRHPYGGTAGGGSTIGRRR